MAHDHHAGLTGVGQRQLDGGNAVGKQVAQTAGKAHGNQTVDL